MKNRILLISIFAAMLLAVGFCYFWPKLCAESHFVHWTFHGTVLSYEDAEDGLRMVIDNDATSDNKTFLITDSTMFPDETTKEQIQNRKTGFRVTIESDLYPATMITP